MGRLRRDTVRWGRGARRRGIGGVLVTLLFGSLLTPLAAQGVKDYPSPPWKPFIPMDSTGFVLLATAARCTNGPRSPATTTTLEPKGGASLSSSSFSILRLGRLDPSQQFEDGDQLILTPPGSSSLHPRAGCPAVEIKPYRYRWPISR